MRKCFRNFFFSLQDSRRRLCTDRNANFIIFAAIVFDGLIRNVEISILSYLPLSYIEYTPPKICKALIFFGIKLLLQIVQIKLLVVFLSS